MHARLRGRRGESARPTISHTQCHGGSQCDVITSLLRRCLIAVSTAYISEFSTTTLCLEFAKHYATVMIWRTPRRRRFKRKQRQTDIYASPSSFRESVNETVGLLASECRGEFRCPSAIRFMTVASMQQRHLQLLFIDRVAAITTATATAMWARPSVRDKYSLVYSRSPIHQI